MPLYLRIISCFLNVSSVLILTDQLIVHVLASIALCCSTALAGTILS